MVTIADGRFELPTDLNYNNQHVYVDKEKKLIGLDEIGYAYLKNPTELKIIAEKTLKIGEPFAVISTDMGITTLNSPVAGKIKTKNHDALSDMSSFTYTKGYIIEMENIDDIDSSMVSGEEVEKWGNDEVRSLLYGHYNFKVIEIGDSATGKTAIKVRFTDDYFKKDLKTTLGVDFGSKSLNIVYTGDGDALFAGTARFIAKMNVWDAAGQDHYEKIRGMYYRGAKGAIMVYDVNNPVSFSNLDTWISELEENIGKKVPVLLVGNKIDLERKVPKEDALAYAKKNGYIYFECSAKTGEGVEDAFKELAIMIYKREEGLE